MSALGDGEEFYLNGVPAVDGAQHDPGLSCIWCDMARALPDGKGGIVWAVTMATPECEHETIEGRT